MAEHKIERIEDETDPRRCQALMKGGTEQCQLVSVPDTNYCACHGGAKIQYNKEKNDANLYRLDKYHARIQRMKGHSEAKGLQNELGILRMVLEERLQSCTDNVELVMQSQQISDLVMKIERLVTSMNKMEEKLGNYLSKTQLLSFAQKVIGILQAEIENPELIETIADQMIASLREKDEEPDTQI